MPTPDQIEKMQIAENRLKAKVILKGGDPDSVHVNLKTQVINGLANGSLSLENEQVKTFIALDQRQARGEDQTLNGKPLKVKEEKAKATTASGKDVVFVDW